MIVQCTHCSQDLRLADDQVTAEGTRVLCPRCKTIFVARPDGATSADVAPPETAADAGGDDPDAGFRLPVGDEQSAPPSAGPSHTDATREDVPQGRRAEVSEDDDGDFDLVSQLGIGAPSADPAPPAEAPPAPPADLDDFDLRLDESIDLDGPSGGADASFRPEVPLDDSSGADDDELSFELDDDTFELPDMDTPSGPDDEFKLELSDDLTFSEENDAPRPPATPAAPTGRQEETAFDLPALEPPPERERSLDDIFAEDDAPPDRADTVPTAASETSGTGVAPGGEIDGSFGSGESDSLPPQRSAAVPRTTGKAGPRLAPQVEPPARSGMPGWLMILMVLLVLGGAAGAWIASQDASNGRNPVEAFFAEIRSITSDDGPPALTLPVLAIDDPTGARESIADGEVYAIRGRVRNTSADSAYLISLEAEVIDADGRFVGKSSSFAGNTVPTDQMAELGISEIRARLDREIGDGGDNVRIPSGGSLPFLIVVYGIPGGELTYRDLEATSRLPATPPGSSATD